MLYYMVIHPVSFNNKIIFLLNVACSFLNRSDGFMLESGKKLVKGGYKYETLQHHVDSMQFRE